MDSYHTQFCWALIDVWDSFSWAWDAKRHAAYFDSYVDFINGSRCSCCFSVSTVYVRDYTSIKNAVGDYAFVVQPLTGATGTSCRSRKSPIEPMRQLRGHRGHELRYALCFLEGDENSGERFRDAWPETSSPAWATS